MLNRCYVWLEPGFCLNILLTCHLLLPQAGLSFPCERVLERASTRARSLGFGRSKRWSWLRPGW